LTDGNGGLVFLKTLLAEYLAQKYGIEIPNENGVLDRLEAPNAEELVDNFPKIAGKFPKSRRDTNAYRIYGTKEPDSFLNNTTFIMDADALLSRAKEEKVTVTALLAAALMKAAIRLQASEIVHERNFKPVKILLPCDLRRMYPGCEKTLAPAALALAAANKITVLECDILHADPGKIFAILGTEKGELS
jgi:hypothetical protein